MFGYLRVTTLLSLPLLLTACAPAPEQQVIELQGATMGTSYSIQVMGLPPAIEPEELQGRIDTELERVNDLMSTYLASSELTRFNRSRTTDWVPVSSDLASLVKQALWTSKVSGGAFDATVGPLVNLWGFGPDHKPDAVPSETDITKAKALVGFHKLSVRTDPPALRKSEPALYLDLSAIAKGYGVDRVADLLEGAGIASYLVEIGGELRGRGHNGQDLPWRIAIERPEQGTRRIYKIVMLRDGAMATSGDYRNFFEQDGKLYSHTIDPATGRPVTHGLASVTVLAPRASRADALATAFEVLGPKKGLALAESLKTPALFIVRTENGLSEEQSSAFAAYLRTDPKADR